MSLNTAELMQKVAQLRILTSRLVDEQLAGDYHSAFKGQGMEFDELRAYAPGDDVRSIDWNVTARTGYPYVKRFCEERELTVMLLVDISGSTAFGSSGKTKAELAAEVACLLALTSVRNQDKVGLVLFSDHLHVALPPRKGRNAVQRIVREILASEGAAAGGTDLRCALDALERLTPRRAVVFLLSDFFAPARSYEGPLAVAARRHDLVCCPLRDPAERTLPAAGLLELEDPETGESAFVDFSSRAVRDAFRAAAEKEDAAFESMIRRHHLSAMHFETDVDPIGEVRKFLRKRANQARA